MAEDAPIFGGLFDFSIRNAMAEPSEPVTGGKANVISMALAQVRRKVEIDVKSMSETNPYKKAFLQGPVSSVQRGSAFTCSACDRRKRDADGIDANFR